MGEFLVHVAGCLDPGLDGFFYHRQRGTQFVHRRGGQAACALPAIG